MRSVSATRLCLNVCAGEEWQPCRYWDSQVAYANDPDPPPAWYWWWACMAGVVVVGSVLNAL